MADNSVLVTISGAALSLLLYENVRSAGDQMGLLLGSVQTFITKNVTDCDRQVEHVKHHINIETVVACSKDILQDALGRIDTEKIGNLIKNKEKRVVGWFQFRRHSFLQQTMRDKIMHKQFASHFVGFNVASEEHFIMFLLNASTTNAFNATHKYRHLCLQYKRGKFQPVALRINNLGADAARHDGSDYKPVPESKPKESDYFTELVDDLKLNSATTSSVKLVTAIQERADQYLNELMSKVCKSDQEISDLQKQVNELRAKVQKGTWAKNIRQKEKAAEKITSAQNERIYTTALIHGSPHSTNSGDLFDSYQSPVGNNVSHPSTYSSNAHVDMKNLNIERKKQHVYSKEMQNHSTPEISYCDFLQSDSSPESTRSKEGTPIKNINKGNFDEKFSNSKRQSNSPKNTGKRSERYSFGDHGEQS